MLGQQKTCRLVRGASPFAVGCGETSISHSSGRHGGRIRSPYEVSNQTWVSTCLEDLSSHSFLEQRSVLSERTAHSGFLTSGSTPLSLSHIKSEKSPDIYSIRANRELGCKESLALVSSGKAVMTEITPLLQIGKQHADRHSRKHPAWEIPHIERCTHGDLRPIR